MSNFPDIRVLFMDCDGVLTDGKIIYTSEGIEIKEFSAYDGMGISLLHEAGIIPVVITGRETFCLTKRCQDLRIEHLYMGISNKKKQAEEVLNVLGFSFDQAAFIGDDWNDYLLMQAVAFSAAPPQAADEIKCIVNHICQREGGHGAVREFIDLLLHRKGCYEETIQSILSHYNMQQ